MPRQLRCALPALQQDVGQRTRVTVEVVAARTCNDLYAARAQLRAQGVLLLFAINALQPMRIERLSAGAIGRSASLCQPSQPPTRTLKSA